MNKIQSLIKLLKKYNLTISSCESVTGGKLASILTSFDGASLFYVGSIISYSNYVKTNIVNINSKLIKKYGVVSQEIASEMAKKTNTLLNSDMCISYTGNAGLATIEKKERGLVYSSFIYKNKLFSTKFISKKNNRKEIIIDVIIKSIDWILRIMEKEI